MRLIRLCLCMEGSSADRAPHVEYERALRFELSDFERLLRRVSDAGRRFVTHDELPTTGETPAGVLLRHDVALSLDRAVTMARLEATLRINGTYCVAVDAPLYDASTVVYDRALRTISRLGHDVGLLFDPGAHWEGRPDESTFRAAVRDERETLERLLGRPVDVVSFRGSPAWTRDVSLPELVHADRVPPEATHPRLVDRELRGTDPFATGVPERFQLVVHPGLWQPAERSEHAVLETCRRDAHGQVDDYFDAFDVA